MNFRWQKKSKEKKVKAGSTAGLVAQQQDWWLNSRNGDSTEGLVAQQKEWWLNSRTGGTTEGMVAQKTKQKNN